jgi:hypothetical protein
VGGGTKREPLRKQLERFVESMMPPPAAAASDEGAGVADMETDEAADEAAGEEVLGAGPSEEELREMPIRELRALAKECGVDVSGCLEKGDFVDALRAPTDE